MCATKQTRPYGDSDIGRTHFDRITPGARGKWAHGPVNAGRGFTSARVGRTETIDAMTVRMILANRPDVKGRDFCLIEDWLKIWFIEVFPKRPFKIERCSGFCICKAHIGHIRHDRG